MRAFLTICFALYFTPLVFSQTLNPPPEILLDLDFEGTADPADGMLPEPTGDDINWVNYDQDLQTGLCVVPPGITPKAWYWESDLGFENPNMADNNAFTSCSYLTNQNAQTKNWLISPQVYIPDSSYWLCWRSLSYYGPDFMDGYLVLASTATNFTTSFTDTLFKAAQTIDRLQVGSLDVNDYVFSNGYIHANGYTDTEYFFVDSEPNGLFYHGKLEPHSVSLADYAGQTVYLAFMHNSKDDYQLQIDDILVSNEKTNARIPADFVFFDIMPNPASDFAFVHWQTKVPADGKLSVFDQSGRLVQEKNFNTRLEGQVYLELQDYLPGIYYCRLETAKGQATKKLVKM